jgi:hypothetical protein
VDRFDRPGVGHSPCLEGIAAVEVPIGESVEAFSDSNGTPSGTPSLTDRAACRSIPRIRGGNDFNSSFFRLSARFSMSHQLATAKGMVATTESDTYAG